MNSKHRTAPDACSLSSPFFLIIAFAVRGRVPLLGTAAMPDPLIARLKTLIVTTLKLEDVTPAQMADDEPLIGSGLNLDSIDALELVVTLEKEFGIKISSSEESRTALASIAHLAEFIRARADPARLPR
jgi:acyl carrier protein